MRKFNQIFKNQFANLLTYRMDLVSLFVTSIFNFIALYITWSVIFKTNPTFDDFSFLKMIQYYLAVLFVGLITDVYLADIIGEEIKNGDFTNYLLKPYPVWKNQLANKLATKLNYLIFTLPIFVIFITILNVSGLLFENLLSGITSQNILVGVIIASLVWLMNFFMEYSIGLIAFWTNEVWSLKHFKWIAINIFSGKVFPLNLLSESLLKIFGFIPLSFLYFVPAMYIIGKRDFSEYLFSDLSKIFLWTIFFAWLSNYLIVKGLKRYESVGR